MPKFDESWILDIILDLGKGSLGAYIHFSLTEFNNLIKKDYTTEITIS